MSPRKSSRRSADTNLAHASTAPLSAMDFAPPTEENLPGSSELVRGMNASVKAQLAGASTLADFLRTAGALSHGDRLLLVDQALVMLELTYVHLAMKRAMHAVDPIQRLKLLRYRLAEMGENDDMSEIAFHNEMTDIFNALRDLHTNYLLPAPFNNSVAVLPFMVEEYFEGGQAKYIVSKIYQGFQTDTFKPGVEVLFWNGIPIHRAIELNAARQAGSNRAARFAQGLASLTTRPMIRSLPPDEQWVVIGYRTSDGHQLEHRQEWIVLSMASGSGALNAIDSLSTAMGIDIQTDAINEINKLLYAPRAVEAANLIANAEVSMAAPAEGMETTMPTVFRARDVTTPSGTFGYIRIFTFNVNDADSFVSEFVRLAELLPQDGLIVDVRSNGGGLIYAGERLLQVLTPYPIEPERVEFVNTPLTLSLCRKNAPSPMWSDFDLSPWVESIALSVQTGAAYSRAFPITDPESCNAIGQRYFGPVVLITDALCYSCTDIFAAGFQDHGIGQILGVHANTGAGGANVWTHELLRILMEGPDSPFKPLPGGAGMRVAIRRTIRVGPRAGTPVEDLGVVPDYQHQMTKNDLINGNVDLINHAAEILTQMPPRQFKVEVTAQAADSVTLRTTTLSINRIDFYLNGRPLKSIDVPHEKSTRTTRLALPEPGNEPRILDVRGYAWQTPVASRKFTV